MYSLLPSPSRTLLCIVFFSDTIFHRKQVISFLLFLPPECWRVSTWIFIFCHFLGWSNFSHLLTPYGRLRQQKLGALLATVQYISALQCNLISKSIQRNTAKFISIDVTLLSVAQVHFSLFPTVLVSIYSRAGQIHNQGVQCTESLANEQHSLLLNCTGPACWLFTAFYKIIIFGWD